MGSEQRGTLRGANRYEKQAIRSQKYEDHGMRLAWQRQIAREKQVIPRNDWPGAVDYLLEPQRSESLRKQVI